MATISTTDTALEHMGAATLQQNLRSALSMHSQVETQNFSLTDGRGTVEVSRISITTVGSTDDHLVLLSRALSEIRDEVFAGRLNERDKTNAPTVYNNPVTNCQVYIPVTFVEGLNEGQATDMLIGLNHFNAQEAVLRSALAEVENLTGREANYTTVSNDGVDRSAIKISLSSDTRRGIDPIHDFSKQLNRALGVNVFSQATNQTQDGKGYTQLSVDPLNVAKLERLPQEKKELLGRAIENPREFVQEQRRQSGILGSIQAKFDDTAKEWVASATQPAAPAQGSAKA